MSAPAPISVLVADDEPLVRAGVTSILRTTGARNRVEAALIAVHARQT